MTATTPIGGLIGAAERIVTFRRPPLGVRYPVAAPAAAVAAWSVRLAGREGGAVADG
jgi:hypothetical protein